MLTPKNKSADTDGVRTATDNGNVEGVKGIIDGPPRSSWTQADYLLVRRDIDSVHLLQIDGDTGSLNVGGASPSHVPSRANGELAAALGDNLDGVGNILSTMRTDAALRDDL